MEEELRDADGRLLLEEPLRTELLREAVLRETELLPRDAEVVLRDTVPREALALVVLRVTFLTVLAELLVALADDLVPLAELRATELAEGARPT